MPDVGVTTLHYHCSELASVVLFGVELREEVTCSDLQVLANARCSRKKLKVHA